MEKEYTVGPFDFGGKSIEAQFESLPGETEGVIRDFIDDGKHGLAQAAVLHVALKRLTADGRVIFKNAAKGAQRTRSIQGVNQLPSPREYYDRKNKESLVRRLTREVVKREFWLADLFPDTFDEFVEEDDEANPTDDQSEAQIRKVS